MIFYPSWLLFAEEKIAPALLSDKYGYSSNSVRNMIHNVVENAAAYIEIMDTLSDEESRNLLSLIVLFRTGFSLELTKGIKTKQVHYWDDGIYRFSDKDIIIDGGGFTGDSLKTFAESGHICKEYHLFEPTEAIVQAEEIARGVSFRTVLHRAGLYNRDGELKFALRAGSNGPEGVSAVDEDGESSIPVVRLDSILGEEPTFVKLDVEGSELAVLDGGKHIFGKNTSFAVCAYHKLNDIIDIYNWLKANGNYQYYMRAERDNLMIDFVLYAISGRKEDNSNDGERR